MEANGNLALTGPWNNARLTGQVVIPKATFATKFFQAGPHPDIILVNQPAAPEGRKTAAGNLAFWENLQVDLTLQSAGEVWIKNKDLQVDMQGSLKVLKTPGQDKMAVAGVMRAVQGTIDIQGRTFKVAEGSGNPPRQTRGAGYLSRPGHQRDGRDHPVSGYLRPHQQTGAALLQQSAPASPGSLWPTWSSDARPPP